MADSKPRSLYIVYNANGSVMGKLSYAYRKITCDKEGESACAACDITHGGLSLHETPKWVEAKKDLEASSNVRVVQLHRDELSAELKDFIKQNDIKLPTAILDKDGLSVVMDHAAFASCRGDARLFVQKLKETGALD